MKAKQKKEITIDKKEIIIVSLLLLVGFILRLIYLSQIKEVNLLLAGGDMITYHNQAIQILNGSFPKGPYYYNPLYSYFLALIYSIFGPNPYIVRKVQAIMGIILCLLIYLIARNVFDRKVALISLFLSTIYGLFMLYETCLLIEVLSTFLITLSLFFLLNPSYKNLALAGISLGLSALARANILLFIPFLLIWMLKSSRVKGLGSRVIRFGFLCLIILLTISPCTIRNYLASGKFVLISTNGPVLLWIGNNPYATGEYKYPPSPYNEMVAERVKKEGDKAYIKEVISFIKEDPKGFLRLLFKKFLLFWSSLEIDNNFNSLIQRGYSHLLSLSIFIGFGIIGPLALIGILLSLSSFKR
ncbi:MAG: glycosyltransferase family 39 protein, partial [bacterium]